MADPLQHAASWEALDCLRVSVAAAGVVRARNVPWWRAIRAAAAAGRSDRGRHVLAALPRWVVG